MCDDDRCVDGKLVKIKDGVLTPCDFSFKAVNEFVHHPKVHFEELQWTLLAIASEVERMRRDHK